MLRDKKSIMILSIMLFEISCNSGYLTFKNALKEFRNNDISRVEYDSIINSLYLINKTSFNLNTKIKLSGSYAAHEYNELKQSVEYRTLKFTDSSYVFASYKFSGELNNNSIIKSEGTSYRYNYLDGELIMEYLLNRDYDLHHIYKYAHISITGDTLIFYKTAEKKKNKINHEVLISEKFIYYSDLTALPILPK